MAGIELEEVDSVEILTLVDNYVDLVQLDSNEVVTRAIPIKDMEVKGSVLAEHGFSALVKTSSDAGEHTLLFDFGFSPVCAPYNVESLNVDLSGVEVLALSHGHLDHFGALVPMAERLSRKGLPFYLHPAAFTSPRFLKIGDTRILFPSLDREVIENAGVEIVETARPALIAEGTILFLGEIDRLTDFEKGMPNAYCEVEGEERWDPIPDDTGIAVNVKGKGLVVISGCAHAGIVNTVKYAEKVTGVGDLHVVMGGFHLTGPAFEPIIGRTVEEIGKMEPDYVVPTHCTGRNAVLAFERAMPERFILNMAGTRLTFSGV